MAQSLNEELIRGIIKRIDDRLTNHGNTNEQLVNSIGLDKDTWITLALSLCSSVTQQYDIDLVEADEKYIQAFIEVMTVGIVFGVDLESEIKSSIDKLFEDF